MNSHPGSSTGTLAQCALMAVTKAQLGSGSSFSSWGTSSKASAFQQFLKGKMYREKLLEEVVWKPDMEALRECNQRVPSLSLFPTDLQSPPPESLTKMLEADCASAF